MRFVIAGLATAILLTPHLGHAWDRDRPGNEAVGAVQLANTPRLPPPDDFAGIKIRFRDQTDQFDDSANGLIRRIANDESKCNPEAHQTGGFYILMFPLDDGYDSGLAYRRARRIKETLESLGVAPDKVTILVALTVIRTMNVPIWNTPLVADYRSSLQLKVCRDFLEDIETGSKRWHIYVPGETWP